MTLCRPISAHYKTDRIDMFIPEAELIDVKDQIGEQLYITLLDFGTTYQELMDGGIYEVAEKKYIFKGLKSAIAYFVYCRLIRNSDGQLTPYGFVNKDTDVSQRPELKERIAAASEAKEIGQAYLNECLQYIRLHPDLFPVTEPDCIERTTTKSTYRINEIGD
jgi:hypothetical protein